MPKISKHASTRMLQRCGIQKKTQAKVVRRTWRHGITHSEASSKRDLCHWIDGLYLSHRNPNKILLYGNGAYLFKDDTLLTVIKIPEQFMPYIKELKIVKGDRRN